MFVNVLQMLIVLCAIVYFSFSAWYMSSHMSSMSSKPTDILIVVGSTSISAFCSGVKLPKMVE